MELYSQAVAPWLSWGEVWGLPAVCPASLLAGQKPTMQASWSNPVKNYKLSLIPGSISTLETSKELFQSFNVFLFHKVRKWFCQNIFENKSPGKKALCSVFMLPFQLLLTTTREVFIQKLSSYGLWCEAEICWETSALSTQNQIHSNGLLGQEQFKEICLTQESTAGSIPACYCTVGKSIVLGKESCEDITAIFLVNSLQKLSPVLLLLSKPASSSQIIYQSCKTIDQNHRSQVGRNP